MILDTINVMLEDQKGHHQPMEEDDADKVTLIPPDGICSDACLQSGDFSDSSADSDWYPEAETAQDGDYEASPNGTLKKPANYANRGSSKVKLP